MIPVSRDRLRVRRSPLLNTICAAQAKALQNANPGAGDKPVESVESVLGRSDVREHAHRAELRAAAASWSSCAPPSGSGTIPSITRSSRQCAASGLNAEAAFGAWDASRQRIEAHPSGE